MSDVPTDNEWIALGNAAKSVRDLLMDFCVLSCNRFGISSKMYKCFKTLDASFLKVRSKLDDYVCSAYPINQGFIGNGHSITGVFFGKGIGLSNYDYLPPYKRGQRPKSFDAGHTQLLSGLFTDIDALLIAIDRQPHIARRFKEKEARAILTRFKKHVNAAKILAG